MENPLLEKLRPHWLTIVLGLLGLIFLVYGLMSFSGQKQTKSDMVFTSAENAKNDHSQTKKISANLEQIIVDVEGAVQKPGVYTLASDARIQDALVAAGGMSTQADREKVAQQVNLAARLTDGVKLYIPFIGDPSTSSGFTRGRENVLGSTSALININTASASELDTLKGVGPMTAAKIIDNRPYGSVDELLTKKVIGQKVFEGIKEKVSAY